MNCKIYIHFTQNKAILQSRLIDQSSPQAGQVCLSAPDLHSVFWNIQHLLLAAQISELLPPNIPDLEEADHTSRPSMRVQAETKWRA